MIAILEEDQIKKIIKKYYKEVEGIEVNVNFSSYQDYQFTSVDTTISKGIDIAGVKVTASEDLDSMKIAEIFNHYLPNDYDFKKVSFSSYRVDSQRDDYDERVRATVEFEPVEQKKRERKQ